MSIIYTAIWSKVKVKVRRSTHQINMIGVTTTESVILDLNNTWHENEEKKRDHNWKLMLHI